MKTNYIKVSFKEKIKNIGFKIILALIIYAVIFAIPFVDGNLRYDDGKVSEDKTIINLKTKVESFAEGLPYAINRANQWNSNCNFIGVSARYDGKENILQKYGVLQYVFSAKDSNTDSFHVCNVYMDTRKQVIDRVYVYNYNKLSSKRGLWYAGGNFTKTLVPSNWKVDIKDAFEFTKNTDGYDDVLNDDQATLIITGTYYVWVIEMYSEHKSIRIDVDPVHGYIKHVSGVHK